MEYYVMTPNKHVTHKEGDVWEENGKTWTIKNGIKKSTGKLDSYRRELVMPIGCPKCKCSMKSKVHEPFWKLYKLCLNCVIDMEHEIKKAGKWEAYERAKVEANAVSFYKDLEQYVEDFTNVQTADTFVTEDGAKESWIDSTKHKAEELGKNELKQLDAVIKDYANK